MFIKVIVGKAGWTVLFCGTGTIAALAAELFCFSEGGMVFLLEIFFLMITAPIAALYYLFTYIFLTGPKNKILFFCVTAFITVVLTVIYFGSSLLIAALMYE